MYIMHYYADLEIADDHQPFEIADQIDHISLHETHRLLHPTYVSAQLYVHVCVYYVYINWSLIFYS